MAKGFGNRLKERTVVNSQENNSFLTLNAEDNNSSMIVTARKNNRLIELPPERFKPDPSQPRQKFIQSEINELMLDMLKNFQLQAILVREPDENGIYPILLGEKRWRAISASEGKIPTVLAIQVSSDIELDDLKVLMIQLSENKVRSNISIIEEAHAYQKMVELCKSKGETQKVAAELLNISPSQLTKYLSLISAPDDVIALATTKKTQDVEVLYNLTQAAKNSVEGVEQFIQSVQGGEIESDGLRKATKKMLSESKRHQNDSDAAPASTKSTSTRNDESQQKSITNIIHVEKAKLHFPKNSNEVEMTIESEGKQLLLVMPDAVFYKLKSQLTKAGG